MKHTFSPDVRLAWGLLGSSRNRRCAEIDRQCADPAARHVTGGCLPVLGACPGNSPNLLYR